MARSGRSDAAALPAEQALAALAAAARRRITRRERGQAARLVVGAGECCRAVGALAVAEALEEEIAAQALPIRLRLAGCTGMCYQDVQVTLQRRGEPDLSWGRVEPDHARTLVAITAGVRAPTSLPFGMAWAPEPVCGLPGPAQVPFLAGQRRLLFEPLGRVDPIDLDEALQRGAYRGLGRALTLSPEAVIAEIDAAGLSGRGGAYFPTARKWQPCRQSGRLPRYLVVNAEEGEPGVFKDRHLLEGDPHRVVEGALVAAYALGVEQIFIYVHGQACLAQERLGAALGQAHARGLLGTGILGTSFTCSIELRAGGGGYVLGEESVLLESIEGHRAMPRVRPPLTVVAGLWGQPTVINNVETLANVPLILDRGAEAFAAVGTTRGTGTKLVAVSGDVARPGLIEVDIGTPMRSVLIEIAGGVPGGRALQAVLSGGPSGQLLPPDKLDTPLEPRQPDVLLGSGNLVALDETRSLLEVVRRLTRFNAEESCGKCTPCREGVQRMAEILDRVANSEGRPSDRVDLLDLGEIAALASLCGLGKMAPGPVVSALHAFQLPGLAAGPEGGSDADHSHG